MYAGQSVSLFQLKDFGVLMRITADNAFTVRSRGMPSASRRLDCLASGQPSRRWIVGESKQTVDLLCYHFVCLCCRLLKEMFLGRCCGVGSIVGNPAPPVVSSA